MTSLAAMAAKVSGAKYALTDYNQAKTNLDWLVVAGANLASASTISPTNEFHIVTGTTTIDTITLSGLTAVAGQQVRFLFTGTGLTIRNNGGGTGNIRTRGGVDRLVGPNETVSFIYDGTVWREAVTPQGTQLDRKTITADVAGISATTEGTAVSVITGNSVTYDGTEVRVEFWCAYVTGTAGTVTFVILRDATIVGQSVHNLLTGQPVKVEAFDTPSSGARTYAVKVFVNANSTTIKAGAGGSGALLPAVLRVTKA